MFIQAVLFRSPVFRRLKGITFQVHKNPIFAFSKHFLCLLKHGALEGITRVSEEQTFTWWDGWMWFGTHTGHRERSSYVVWPAAGSPVGCYGCWISGAVYCLLLHSLEVERPLVCTSTAIFSFACLSNSTNTGFSLHWVNCVDWPWLSTLHFSMDLFLCSLNYFNCLAQRLRSDISFSASCRSLNELILNSVSCIQF